LLPLKKKNKKDTGRVCLRKSEEGVSIAVSKLTGTQLQLQQCQFFSALALSDTPDLIEDYIDQHNLENQNCSLVLSPSEYHLLLTDAPQVNEAEICDALWWKVKDLVNFDIDNAQIDYLELPADSQMHQGRKIYAVVADKAKVKAKIEWAEKLGLRPTTVEVPETALLHIAADLCPDIVGTSILFLEAEQSLLMLMSEGNMYLARTLQYNYLDRMEAVVLDLQRSMDYYESQIGKPPCQKVIVLPQQNHDTAMMATLLNNIGVEVTTFDINELITSDSDISIETQQHCLVAISGALRLDSKANK
jgi:MSHA biogenesis protein MshI